MKKLARIIALSALVATLWLPALANNTVSLTAATAIQQNDDEAKAALYNEFLKNYKANEPAAYATAKEYLQKYPAESEQTAYLKRWIAAYEAREKNKRKEQVTTLLQQQKFAEAFAAAKAILADEPNDVGTLNNAVFAALYAAGVNKNESFNAEAANYARKSVQLIQSGQPFDKRDETLGWLHSALGFFSLKTNPAEAITNYIKAASFEGAAKKDPQTYLFLADAYRAAEYTKVAADFKTKCSTAEQQATPECTALSDRLNAVVDRMIDAYARAIALATDPKFASAKAAWMSELTTFYKFRNKDSVVGLDQLIAGILAKPLPTGAIETTTTSTPPSTSQTTTPASGTTAPASTTNTAGSTSTGTQATPASTNSTGKTTTTPKTPRRR